MTSSLPLSGIRVANFGWVWAGPVVGQTLGFLGAEVYKIESRARIDLTRMLPPFGEGVRDPDRSLSNHACWAGNGSVSLNLKQPEGRALARELIATCDVVIENFGPGVMEGLELGWDDLRALKPDLVMFSMPAAGLTGPLKEIRTYGLSLTSTTGLDSLTGYVDGPPIPVENAFSDPYNGIMGAFAILTALAPPRPHRPRPAHRLLATGSGHADGRSGVHGLRDERPRRGTDRQPSSARDGGAARRVPVRRRGPLDRDRGHLRRGVAGARRRDGATGMGDRAGARDARAAGSTRSTRSTSASPPGRPGFDDYALAARLQAAGVAATPVLNVADLLRDPHYRARGTFIEVQHPLGFKETIYGAYVKTSRSQIEVRTGPRIGQDNERVFKGLLGMDDARYQQLIENEIIY